MVNQCDRAVLRVDVTKYGAPNGDDVMSVKPLAWVIVSVMNRCLLVVFGAVVSAVLGLACAPLAQAETVLLRPGDAIFTTGTRCTLGYVVRSADGAEGVTAGHCGKPGDAVAIGAPAESGGQVVGVIVASTGVARTTADPDVALLRFEGNPAGSLQTLLPVDRVLRPVLGVMTAERAVRDGLRVCKVGSTTGQTCGPIDTVTPDGHFLVHAHCDHGDSGGPVVAVADRGVYMLGISISKPTDTQCYAQAMGPFVLGWGLSVESRQA